MPASAKRNRSAPAQTEFLAILIHDREVAFHTQWAIIENRDFCACQGFLRIQKSAESFRDGSKITARMEKHKQARQN
jgi:hypothetical protein